MFEGEIESGTNLNFKNEGQERMWSKKMDVN